MPAAIEAEGLIKFFGKRRVVDGVSLSVPEGAIYGVLGPNGAGKTTTLRMLLGIIEPDGGKRRVLGRGHPLDAAYNIGYLPEERGLYPAMNTLEAMAFLGSLRGLSLRDARRRAERMLSANGMGDVARRPVRTLSKGMAQTVQLLGTFIHRPKLIVLDEPFSGLDPLNQQGLEELIRAERDRGATILFSTHVMSHAERLCEALTIIGDGKVRFSGTVEAARATLRPRVHLVTRQAEGSWRAALPADAVRQPGETGWRFALPPQGIEPLLGQLIAGGAGIETLSIERPSLHDAFVAIVGGNAAAEDESIAA
jgi:ABC-2 type transport system ATP-binding protein